MLHGRTLEKNIDQTGSQSMAFSLSLAAFFLYLSALLLRKGQRLEPIMRRDVLDHWVTAWGAACKCPG
jgi:hypothetical protein